MAATPNTPDNTKSANPPVEPPQPAPSSTPAPPKSSSNPLKIVLIVIAVIVVLGILGSIATAFVARQFVQKGFEAATGGKAKIDTSKGTVTIKGKDGSTSFSTEAKLPADFPSDVPVYSPSTVKFSTKSGTTFTVTLSTDDSVEKVGNYYKSQLAAKGWSSKDGGEMSFASGVISSYEKDSRQVVVTIVAANGSTTQTAISIAVTPKTSSSGESQ